jgi:hypothetical protein
VLLQVWWVVAVNLGLCLQVNIDRLPANAPAGCNGFESDTGVDGCVATEWQGVTANKKWLCSCVNSVYCYGWLLMLLLEWRQGATPSRETKANNRQLLPAGHKCK